MKLQRLLLHGFKSFADKTELHFHDGVTAIVGPNGSGKSNISDAIRWVLGEQRASAIRSAKMEEAIFQGTVERRRVNRAEVGLVFDNIERRLGVPYDEVEIKRIVFREGGSDYQLNRQSVRLRDILDVCRDTGLGTNVYTVIEQRMVDAILSDRADERRQLFEEASGIGRYKDRRKVAQRRLEGAEADLARLDDLIGEVQSKVRSLARQKGKAQRYKELRERRLTVEVSLAQADLERNRSALEQIGERLEELTGDEPRRQAALATAETELERRRLEAAELSRERGATATRLEEVNRRIAEHERSLAVDQERRVNAQRRVAHIDAERAELHARKDALLRSIEELDEERKQRERELEAATAEVSRANEHQQRQREELARARTEEQEVRQRDEELAGRLSLLRSQAAEADARVTDAEQRLERLAEERVELEAELAMLEEQGDLFDQRSRELIDRIAGLTAERDQRRSELSARREDESRLRRAQAEAEDRAHRLGSRVAALEAEEREFQGFAAPVAAALAARGELPGLIGAMAEELEIPAGRAAALEAAMGSLLQALVVRDADAVARVRAWVAERGGTEGVLALLPADALPKARDLLEALEFAGNPPGEPFLLGRRERLIDLRGEAERASEERRAAEAAREAVGARVADAEEALRLAEERLRAAEGELKRAESDETARSGLRVRTMRHHEELQERHHATVSALEEAKAAGTTAREEAATVESELEEWRARRAETAGRRAEREGAWEAARDHEAELRVAHARAEGALAAADRRLTDSRGAAEEAVRRLAALEVEEKEHRSSLDEVESRRGALGAELEVLFRERDRILADLHARDQRLTEASEAAEELERRVRSLRKDSTELAEERHRLELQRAEAESGLRSVRERLEAEWGRPLESLQEEVEVVREDAEVLRAELIGITADLERLGPINMLAMEEHEEESKRLEFLTSQRDDLVKAKDDLLTAIRRINRTAREHFEETFNQVRENFKRTFQALFEGGECDVWLTDPEDPLETPIEVTASPRGKRVQRINLLSGGERALTSLALLFAIYLVKPSPFCVLDEVDAPLDDANIGRFVAMLESFKSGTQFIVITHNPRTMEAADYIYGVTMEEPGVSKIVGVRLEEAVAQVAAAP